MINIRELRIGNLLSFKGKWTGEVSELREVTLSIKDNGGVFEYDQFEGIPLTEEWLVRFGFESDTITFRNDGICLGWFSGDRFFYLPTWELTFRHKKQIEYVHQLQNLYFALTGEELIYENK